MNSLRIGICGWGNVATGLYKAINSNSEQIKSAKIIYLNNIHIHI